ncbi:MAG: helix-hairpin-helix domain-containing protein [Parafilimonas sp.]
MQNAWKEYFIFTRRDRRAVIVLFVVIGLLLILPYFLPAKKLEIHIDKELQAELDQYRQDHQANNQSLYFNTASDTTIHDAATNDTTKKELFFFDPNTLSEEGFAKLGLSQKTIHTLINYRNKGGYFKTPEDIRKIYGLSKNDADRLIPYIRITSNKTKQTEETKYDKPAVTTQTQQYKRINVNAATAEDWKAFPGIGDAISNRIIKFRTSIGGFKSIDQVGKTYGLSDSVFQLIKPYLFLKDSSNSNP